MRDDRRVFAQDGDLLGGPTGIFVRLGREAPILRKVLLVLALIAASFAGGAAVNGPGLKWIQGLIGDHLHQGDAIPTLDVDDGPTGAVDPQAVANPGPAAKVAVEEAGVQPTEIPAAPAPLLGSGLSREVRPAKSQSSTAPQPPAALPLPLVKAPPTDPPAEPSPLPDPPQIAPKETEKAEEFAKPATALTGWEDAPGSTPATAVLPRVRLVKDRGPTTDPAVANTGAPGPSDPPPLDGPLPSSPAVAVPAGWSSLRARMKTLGVTKFWVEGSPAGAATFRCVAALDKAGASPRQFEAEGDDEFQAADSALRRVAVWRAAERVNKR